MRSLSYTPALLRSAPVKFVFVRSDPAMRAFARTAFCILQPDRSEWVKSAPERSTFRRSRLERSGRMEVCRFRQRFQAFPPVLTTSLAASRLFVDPVFNGNEIFTGLGDIGERFFSY